MEKENSEKRMYVLVPYNLSDIQKGIQTAHGIAEYGELAHRDFDSGDKQIFDKYNDWVTKDKTIIVLNGGTTGQNSTMSRYLDDLFKLKVVNSVFYEPDLNDAMTAIAFVLDMEKDSHVVQYLKSMGLA